MITNLKKLYFNEGKQITWCFTITQCCAMYNIL